MQRRITIPTKVSPVIVFIVTIQIIFVIIVVAIIINLTRKDNEISQRDERPKIAIDGLISNGVYLPQNYIDDLSISLTSAMELNTTSLNVPSSSATVREDSITLQEFEAQQFSALSFIVDIPDLKQSYQIYYKYPTDVDLEVPFTNNPRAVLCLDEESQIIYSDFNCRSEYPTDTRERIVGDYLNFFKTPEYSVSIDPQDLSQINITPTVATDADDDHYITAIKTFIKNLGVSPGLFEYHVIKY